MFVWLLQGSAYLPNACVPFFFCDFTYAMCVGGCVRLLFVRFFTISLFMYHSVVLMSVHSVGTHTHIPVTDYPTKFAVIAPAAEEALSLQNFRLLQETKTPHSICSAPGPGEAIIRH